MKTLNVVLDIIGIVVSALTIIGGGGNFGDYWEVYGLLFFCAIHLLMAWKNK